MVLARYGMATLVILATLICADRVHSSELPPPAVRIDNWDTLVVDYPRSGACSKMISESAVGNAISRAASTTGINLIEARKVTVELTGLPILKASCASLPVASGSPPYPVNISMMLELPVVYSTGRRVLRGRLVGDYLSELHLLGPGSSTERYLQKHFLALARSFFDELLRINNSPAQKESLRPLVSEWEGQEIRFKHLNGNGIELGGASTLDVFYEENCDDLPDMRAMMKRSAADFGYRLNMDSSPELPFVVVHCQHAGGFNPASFYKYEFALVREVFQPGDGFFYRGVATSSPIISLGSGSSNLLEVLVQAAMMERAVGKTWRAFLSELRGAER